MACKLQEMVVHPTEESFKHMVSPKLLNHCPIKVEDVTNAKTILGSDLTGVRGKTVRHKPDRVEMELTQIPRDLYELHKFVTLTEDVIFVNGIEFLTTLSRKIKFLAVEHIPPHTAEHIRSLLTKIVNIYTRGGFLVRVVLIDMDFEKVADDLELVQVNTTAAREHVGKIDQVFRVVKEQARSVIVNLLFKSLKKNSETLDLFCGTMFKWFSGHTGYFRKALPYINCHWPRGGL